MIENNNIGGNGEAPEGMQDHNGNNTKENINPGAIRKSTTQSILNALSNASGEQFDSVESLIGYMARVGSQKPNVGNEQPKEQHQERQGRVTANDLHEKFNMLQQDLQRKEAALREKELDSDIMRAMGDRFDSDLVDYALSKVKSNIQWNDDGTYAIVDNRGRERYGLDGNPLTIQGLVNEVAKGNPKLLRSNPGNGGSGLKNAQGMFAGAPEEGVPDYSRDPAAFNAWAAKNGLGKRVGLKGVGVSAANSLGSRKIL